MISSIERLRRGTLIRYLPLLIALAMVLVACGAGDDGTETTVAEDTEAPETTEAEEPAPETTEAEEPAEGETSETTAAAAETPEFETTSIRLATSPPEFDTITDAYWLQLLEEAGLEVETFEFETSPDTVRAVAAGEGDLVNTSPLAIMQFIEASGGGLEVVAVELLKTDYYLMATPDLTSVEDLQDGIIGISEPGDLSDSLTRVVLEEAGLDTSTIEFAQIGGTSARIAALADGQIQAGAAHAADGLAAAEEFGLQPLVRFVDYVPDYAQRFLAASPEWLDENPVLAQFIVDSLIDAQRWAQENKEEYIALSEEHVEGISPEIRSEVYDLFAGEGFFGVNGGMDSMAPTAELEQRQGNLGEDFGEPDTWSDSSFVDDYLARNGEY
jgi:ABC-type nitrate/sulfonate/bicarbonate transport system substrate-binding protein